MNCDKCGVWLEVSHNGMNIRGVLVGICSKCWHKLTIPEKLQRAKQAHDRLGGDWQRSAQDLKMTRYQCKICGAPVKLGKNDIDFGDHTFGYLAHRGCWNKASRLERLVACQRHCEAFHRQDDWWVYMAPAIWAGEA